jgi:hypothetical protein
VLPLNGKRRCRGQAAPTPSLPETATPECTPLTMHCLAHIDSGDQWGGGHDGSEIMTLLGCSTPTVTTTVFLMFVTLCSLKKHLCLCIPKYSIDGHTPSPHFYLRKPRYVPTPGLDFRFGHQSRPKHSTFTVSQPSRLVKPFPLL